MLHACAALMDVLTAVGASPRLRALDAAMDAAIDALAAAEATAVALADPAAGYKLVQ